MTVQPTVFHCIGAAGEIAVVAHATTP